MSCLICEAHRELLVEQVSNECIEFNDDWIIRKASKEKNLPGYLYLEPRLHIESFSQLGELYGSFGDWLEKGMTWIQINHNPRKIYLLAIAEAVPHIHFHLVPQYEGDQKGIEYLKLATTVGFPKI